MGLLKTSKIVEVLVTVAAILVVVVVVVVMFFWSALNEMHYF